MVAGSACTFKSTVMVKAAAASTRSDVSSRTEEDFMGELQDDYRNAFLILPEDAAEMAPWFPPETLINKLVSTVYSGPTIGDVEAALALSYRDCVGGMASHGTSRPTIALPEKGLNKMDSKFTLRVRYSANGMADDGYKWRKYGQKFIKNSPYPRSYYRCTNPRCNAKKQVERSAEDPEMLVVTYEGLHMHYAYPHFLHPPRPRDASIPVTTAAAISTVPAVKKAKVEKAGPPTGLSKAKPPRAAVVERSWQELQGEDAVSSVHAHSSLELPEDVLQSPRGLLEDVVPLLVRKPCSNSPAPSNDPSLSSVPSSPPSSINSSSPFSWPHVSSFLDDLSMLSVPSSPQSSSYLSPFSCPHGSSPFDLGMLPAGAV